MRCWPIPFDFYMDVERLVLELFGRMVRIPQALVSVLFTGGAGGLFAVTSGLASSTGKTTVKRSGCQQWLQCERLRLWRVAARMIRQSASILNQFYSSGQRNLRSIDPSPLGRWLALIIYKTNLFWRRQGVAGGSRHEQV